MKKLAKANSLIKEIAAKDKRITPITLEDYPLFQKFFSKEPHTYGNSWTYVTQGMYGIGPNNLGYKFYDGKNLSAVTVYPKIEHPDIHAFYWVRPMGPQILDVIEAEAKKLLDEKNVPTYAKKIFPIQFEYLKKKGFKDTSGFPWHTSCSSEDDTYEELIIDIPYTLKVTSEADKLSRIHRVHQYFRHYAKDERLSLLNFSHKKEVAKKLAADFFNIQKRLNKSNVSDKYDYYNIISNNEVERDRFGDIFFWNKKPVGFHYIVRQDKEYASLYATITLRNKLNHLSEYIIFKSLIQLNRVGVKYLNLGGSENASLDKFKQKFHPQKTNKMLWATYYS